MNSYHFLLERRGLFKLQSSRFVKAPDAERAWDMVMEEVKLSKGNWCVILFRKVE